MNKAELRDWVCRMPKAELHMHIDGSLEASRMLSLAKKHGVDLPYTSEAEVQNAYDFHDLQSFLDLYYLGASVLRDEEDFYFLMMDYLERCRADNIVHCEIMVEPQTYFPNGVDFDTFMKGFERAIAEANATWGQSVVLILSLLRHTPEDECLAVLEQARPWRHAFTAIGLASSERGHPPEKFERLYAAAKSEGYALTIHAGEEGPAEYIWTSLKSLGVARIDHGVRCTEDDALMDFLAEEKIPLTVCPLSNTRLKVYQTMHEHPVLTLLARGLCVTINSDDPAYFGGYLNANYLALLDTFEPSPQVFVELARNSFQAAFLEDTQRDAFLQTLAKWESAA